MTTTPVNKRVQKHRDALRHAGLRPVQIWVPDTRRPDFTRQCHSQCLRVLEADSRDPTLGRQLDDAAGDIEGWTG